MGPMLNLHPLIIDNLKWLKTRDDNTAFYITPCNQVAVIGLSVQS